jgi:cobalamin biosynthesis protein CbiG
MLETIAGLVVMTRDQAKARLRQQLAGTDLVASLLKDRRNAARQEDDPASTSTITTTP